MRALGIFGIAVIVLLVGAGIYAYLGYYDVAASNPHTDVVRWSLEQVQDNSVGRQAKHEIGSAPPLDDLEMIRTGGHHYQEEGCLTCHGGPGIAQAEFAEQMRPEPPDLTKAAATWNDTELFWIIQHGIKMTGMPAFGPTHDEKELWAMVAFVRQLPSMPPSEYDDLVAASREDEEAHHGTNGMHDEHEESDAQ